MKFHRASRFAFFAGVVMFGACGDDATDQANGAGQQRDEGVRSDGTAPNGGDGASDANRDSASGVEGGKDAHADGQSDVISRDVGLDVIQHDVTFGDAGCVAQTPTVPPLKLVPVYQASLNFATFAKQPPGSADWYVVEQGGIIRIVRNGQLLATPFLDISAGIGQNGGERGLLSIAFHPNYEQNGRFFVMATPADGADNSIAPQNADAVVEYHRDANNPDVAVHNKAQDIVVVPASDDNHNGGTIQFGPDGYLYVGTGDGGGECESDKPGSVQDTTRLNGKILKLDVDAPAPFALAGNPFANDRRVYHYGLRNPFRWSFDDLTGDLYIGDVGQSTHEEISVALGNAPGKNFGWPAYEGNGQGTCSGKALGGPSPHAPPIVSTNRAGGGAFSDFVAIIGGRVYRGAAIPALWGVYLFADYWGGELGALRRCGGQTYGPVPVPLFQIHSPTGSPANITAFVEGNDGELYLMYDGSQLGRIELQ